MECTKRHYQFTLIILVMLSVSLIIGICVIKINEKDNDCQEADNDVCLNKDCLEAASMFLNSINDSVNPCDDFYEHSCGNWIASHQISPRGNSAGVFLGLRDILDERLRDLLEGDYDDKLESIKQAKTLFRSCININSIEPLNVSELINAVFNVTQREDIVKNTYIYGENTLLPITVTSYSKNTSLSKIYFSKITPILDKNKTNEKQFLKLVDGFKDFIDTASVVKMEKAISTMTWNITNEGERISIADLSSYVGVDLNKIVNELMFVMNVQYYLNKNDTVYVVDKYYLKQLFDLLNSSTDESLKGYATFRMLFSLSIALPLRYRTVVEDYINGLQSVKYSLSRDIVCANRVNSWMAFAIGRLYVDKYFKESTKKKVGKFVEEIRKSMLQIFDNSQWMVKTTRDAAKEKALAVFDTIGYSTSEKNDKNFKSSFHFNESNLLTNMLELKKAYAKNMYDTLLYIIPRNMSTIPPAIVNAFYNPLQNSINFPAGILQKPFFDENYPNSLLYGVFGAVVGHEFTHGFDNIGALFDKIGNKHNWWDKETKKKFDKRAEGLLKQYGEFNLCRGKPNCTFKIDGKKTLGENIADNGGLKAAYNAYKITTKNNELKHQKLPGVKYTADQLFFAGFAHIWCRKINIKSLSNQLKNEHSPSRARVMVTLMNSVEFSKAFNCPAGSRMNPKQKYGVW